MFARRRAERGQAALLGVVGVMILAIGMYTSYNLSRAVYEKIQLQNAADAAAYSLATLEARTFNFIAFANRAQIANYVQMMEAQSLLSSASFTEGYAGVGGDIAQTLGGTLRAVPGLSSVGAALYQVGKALEATSDAAGAQVDSMESFVPSYIKLKTSENAALFAVSGMLVLATVAQIGTSAEEIVHANDPDARLTLLSHLLAVANGLSFVTAFDFASVSPKGASEEARRARRVMAELSNAARYGSTEAFGASFLVSRGPFESLSLLSGALSGGGLPRWARRIKDTILPATLAPGFVGTTKILSGDGELADIEDTGRSGRDRSFLAVGDAIVAKDRIDRWGDFASVVSARSGKHCRYTKPAAEYGRPFRVDRIPGRLAGHDFRDCEEGAKHAWGALHPGGGGIQPYLTFAPKLRGLSVDRFSFNQPDVWIALSKSSDGMELGNDRDLDFAIQNRGQSASLDARIGGDGLFGSGFAEGMHAVARAQVYYHRPGAWHEPPNLFNPFWGARLAPKGAALDGAFGAINLPGPIANFISDNVWMH